MANKEAYLLCIDIGNSMHKQNTQQPDQSRLFTALNCIKTMLLQKIFNTKNHEIGLVLFGIDPYTDEQGDTNEKTMYIREIGKPDIQFARNVEDLNEHQEPKVIGGDIFDVLDKGVATLDAYVGKKKIAKKLYLFTSGFGDTEYNENRISKLIQSIKTVDVKINAITFDFMLNYNPEENEEIEDDPNQTEFQNINQRLLLFCKQQIPQNLAIFSSKKAINLYQQFKTKTVCTRVSWRGKFYITKDKSIDVQLYKRTSEEKLPSLKSYSMAVDFKKSESTGQIQKEQITYLQDDPQMAPLDVTKIIKGYHYGKQLVPITDAMTEKMEYKTEKCIKLLGFTDQNQVPRHSMMGNVDMVLPCEGAFNQKGLSALINACLVLKKAIIVRYVYREKSSPKLCIFYPYQGSTYQCFYQLEMPTSESIRDFQFNSLKQSTQDQQRAVGDLIDSMDLTEKDEDGDEVELLNVTKTYNPTRQYLFQSIVKKAFSNDPVHEKLPQLDPVIDEYLRPEKQLWGKSKAQLQKIKDIFQFKEFELKKFEDKKVFWREILESQKKLQQQQVQIDENVQVQEKLMDFAELAKNNKFAFEDEKTIVKQISDINPLEDFKKMVEEKKEDLVDLAIKLMQEKIIKFIKESLAGSFYEKSKQCLVELRKCCITQDEPDNFNKFLQALKDEFSKGEHIQYWNLIIKEGITLISKNENKHSNIDLYESKNFLVSQDKSLDQAMKNIKIQEDNELLDQIE